MQTTEKGLKLNFKRFSVVGQAAMDPFDPKLMGGILAAFFVVLNQGD